MKQGATWARGLWVLPVAWRLALVGTLLLADRAVPGVGAVLILLASIVVAARYRQAPAEPAVSTPTTAPASPPDGRRRHAIALAGIFAAALSAFLCNLSFVADPGATFGLAGFLWLSGIGLFAASCWGWSTPVITNDGDEPTLQERWPAWEKVALAGLLLLAAALRLWDLAGFPYNIYGDEITGGRVAIDAYAGGAGPSIFSLLWEGINLPGLWFLAIAKSLELGGGTLWSLRLPAAMFGAAVAIPLYGFVRLSWGRWAAISATAIYGYSAVAVHYSRVNLVNIVTPFFWSFCFLFLLRGLRSRRPLDWGLAGLAGGLSEYGYYGTRLLPVVLAGFFVYLLLLDRPGWRNYLAGFGLIVLGYLIGFGPLVSQYVRNPQLYLGRVRGQLIWDHFPAGWDDFQRMVDTLWPVISENLLSISTVGSQDLIYFGPLLLPAEAALLVLGMALLLRHWRNPASFLMLLVVTGVVLTGGTLVLYGAYPFFAHWIPALPAFYAALGVPVGAWLGEAGVHGRIARIACAVVALGLLGLGLANANFYFRDYYANPDTLRDPAYRNIQIGLETRTTQARYQAQLGTGYTVLILGEEYYLYNPDLPYLVGTQEYRPLTDPETRLPAARQPGKGLAFLFMPGGEQYRSLVVRAHPGGKEGEVRDRAGRVLFYTYILEPGP